MDKSETPIASAKEMDAALATAFAAILQRELSAAKAALAETERKIERLKQLWFADADPRETEYAGEFKEE